MACHLFGIKPQPEPISTDYQLNPYTSVKNKLRKSNLFYPCYFTVKDCFRIQMHEVCELKYNANIKHLEISAFCNSPSSVQLSPLNPRKLLSPDNHRKTGTQSWWINIKAESHKSRETACITRSTLWAQTSAAPNLRIVKQSS